MSNPTNGNGGGKHPEADEAVDEVALAGIERAAARGDKGAIAWLKRRSDIVEAIRARRKR